MKIRTKERFLTSLPSFREEKFIIGILLFAVSVFFAAAKTDWAQDSPSSHVDRAGHAHGDGWQNGAVKSWVARGTVTVYHYDNSGQQSQETFPVTLIHDANLSGGSARGDKFQRLTFKPPEASPDGSGNSFASATSPDAVLTREGTDGNEQWHSAGPLSTQATGPAQRFIESQTERSLEALFNFRKHGKNLEDVTSSILNPQAGGASTVTVSSPHDPAHVTPSLEAAQGKHVIEDSDAPETNGSAPAGSSRRHSTRYFIDDATSLVTRMEFDYDIRQDPFSGQPVALTEVYEFSNYQGIPISSPDPVAAHPALRKKESAAPAATVKFPFQIERYISGQKAESLVFTQAQLNLNLRPENFRR